MQFARCVFCYRCFFFLIVLQGIVITVPNKIDLVLQTTFWITSLPKWSTTSAECETAAGGSGSRHKQETLSAGEGGSKAGGGSGSSSISSSSGAGAGGSSKGTSGSSKGERYQLEEKQHQEQDHNQPQPRLRMPARFHDGEATEHGKSRWKNRVIHNRCVLFGEDILESSDWSKWFGMKISSCQSDVEGFLRKKLHTPL